MAFKHLLIPLTSCILLNFIVFYKLFKFNKLDTNSITKHVQPLNIHRLLINLLKSIKIKINFLPSPLNPRSNEIHNSLNQPNDIVNCNAHHFAVSLQKCINKYIRYLTLSRTHTKHIIIKKNYNHKNIQLHTQQRYNTRYETKRIDSNHQSKQNNKQLGSTYLREPYDSLLLFHELNK